MTIPASPLTERLKRIPNLETNPGSLAMVNLVDQANIEAGESPASSIVILNDDILNFFSQI
jgi:hypothetical protein